MYIPTIFEQGIVNEDRKFQLANSKGEKWEIMDVLGGKQVTITLRNIKSRQTIKIMPEQLDSYNVVEAKNNIKELTDNRLEEIFDFINIHKYQNGHSFRVVQEMLADQYGFTMPEAKMITETWNTEEPEDEIAFTLSRIQENFKLINKKQVNESIDSELIDIKKKLKPGAKIRLASTGAVAEILSVSGDTFKFKYIKDYEDANSSIGSGNINNVAKQIIEKDLDLIENKNTKKKLIKEAFEGSFDIGDNIRFKQDGKEYRVDGFSQEGDKVLVTDIKTGHNFMIPSNKASINFFDLIPKEEKKNERRIDKKVTMNEAMLGDFVRDIQDTKAMLIKKWEKRGPYENFGDKEIRKLHDKWSNLQYSNDETDKKAYNLLNDLDNWASNYTGQENEGRQDEARLSHYIRQATSKSKRKYATENELAEITGKSKKEIRDIIIKAKENNYKHGSYRFEIKNGEPVVGMKRRIPVIMPNELPSNPAPMGTGEEPRIESVEDFLKPIDINAKRGDFNYLHENKQRPIFNEDITITKIIDKVLLRYTKAKRIAVENFLASSVGLSYRNQMENLEADAAIYNWLSHTKTAIRAGLLAMKSAGLLQDD